MEFFKILKNCVCRGVCVYMCVSMLKDKWSIIKVVLLHTELNWRKTVFSWCCSKSTK